MYIVNSYTLAIIFCFITMICWGSWGNTQKLASKNWRYELYYWDYTIGILLFALLLVFTLGSFGDSGRGFLEDIQQVEAAYIASALIRRSYFQCFQYSPFRLSIHCRNGSSFSIGSRTGIGIGSIH